MNERLRTVNQYCTTGFGIRPSSAGIPAGIAAMRMPDQPALRTPENCILNAQTPKTHGES
jgi:hypothetical protein